MNILKKYRNIGFIVLTIIISFYAIKKIAPFFYSGAYPFAETYKLGIRDSLLIKQIQKFKQNNPIYIVPKQCELADHFDKSYNDLFIIFFYYKKENKIIRTWVSHLDSNTSQLGIVSINSGLDIGNWKDLNDEIDENESNEEISKFENRILKKLNVPFKKD